MANQTILQKVLHFFLTKIIIGIAVIGGSVAVIQWVGSSLLDKTSITDNIKNIIQAISNSAIALIAYIFLYKFYEKRKISELSASAFGKYAIIGFLIGFALQSLFILVIYIADGYSVIKINPLASVLSAFAFALTAGFVAEILIIGVFFRLVEEQLGTVIALFVITVLFGILHVNAPGATLLSIISTAIEAGLLIASVYVYTRSLWMVIFFHFAWDFAEPGIFGGINPGNNANESLLTSRITGPAILTGGQTGPQNSLQALLICLFMALLLLWLAKRRNRLINPFWKIKS
jgi:CAAX protease family protein